MVASKVRQRAAVGLGPRLGANLALCGAALVSLCGSVCPIKHGPADTPAKAAGTEGYSTGEYRDQCGPRSPGLKRPDRCSPSPVTRLPVINQPFDPNALAAVNSYSSMQAVLDETRERAAISHSLGNATVTIVSWEPRIIVVDDFITTAEADHLVSTMSGKALLANTVRVDTKRIGKFSTRCAATPCEISRCPLFTLACDIRCLDAAAVIKL